MSIHGAASELERVLQGMENSLKQVQQSQQQVVQQVQQISQQLQQLMQHQGHNSTIIVARRATNGTRNACDTPYEVVPMENLQHPPHWPAGLNRTTLGVMDVQQMTSLLNRVNRRSNEMSFS
eukprot:CAMPEP_0182843224 /NCGR_PEP_ID=MMETSP0006_2-20121128/26070_1 /TAXON_ID=97485 /ORGANISM="Prymnesium parvum, Strain Texoma1" /LENGTH=121 /DNA_ID=CAMNT_0024972995 /DNA_START=195 /DNA_END=560 /DNA_ORIENTATION=+